jgi:hypothetical protein
MANMWAKYRELLGENTARHPEWRDGQGCYNTLRQVDPALADSLHGTGPDPYDHDERVPAFHDHVRRAWGVIEAEQGGES